MEPGLKKAVGCDPLSKPTIAQNYLDFCQALWTDWREERLKLPSHWSSRFQLDYAPEPYLRFEAGTRPLYVLLTNPGAGLPHQHRDTIERAESCIRSDMTYHEASLALAKFYTDPKNLRSGARRRNEAMACLKQMLGVDCIVQFESLPFHSRSLPRKAKIPGLVATSELLDEYQTLLAEALKDVSVITLSAVDSSQSISVASITGSTWLSWQASLLGLDLSQLRITILAKKDDKISRAFLYQRVAGHVRGIVLTMGSNSFPGRSGLEALARAISSSDSG